MDYVTYRGTDYLHIQSLAEAVGVSTATVRNWEKAGHLTFERPLGPVMTFVTRQTVERLMQLKITAAMGAFIRTKESIMQCGT